MNHIGVALSAERDIDKLLEMILAKSRAITASDAGSLYLVFRGEDPDRQDDDLLRFKLTQNDSVAAPFEEFTMPLNEASIGGYAGLTGRVVNVADAYHLPAGSPFQISRSFDDQSGYRTKSMLVVPMRDQEGSVIGVVQLINRRGGKSRKLLPFTQDAELLVAPIARVVVVSWKGGK